MRINSESFGAESGLYTWLDAEIPMLPGIELRF